MFVGIFGEYFKNVVGRNIKMIVRTWMKKQGMKMCFHYIYRWFFCSLSVKIIAFDSWRINRPTIIPHDYPELYDETITSETKLKSEGSGLLSAKHVLGPTFNSFKLSLHLSSLKQKRGGCTQYDC